jgi:hypothetical protein
MIVLEMETAYILGSLKRFYRLVMSQIFIARPFVNVVLVGMVRIAQYLKKVLLTLEV